ncbi:hypothetical protein V496_07778 [Pseudogymnoascus sp. VKM F-4515 (FW-2607)]|nr:hypothetical protein V496_07778 [Pseudogymnoascus sp. VKM F-4515 (FW-2607)]KFY91860.1 hypothetical protein V498_05283 [Pseudogymnoascus sp. VKM F-4517 (FW-2822)]
MKEDGDEQKKGATRAPSCPEPRVRDEKKEAGDPGPEIAGTASAETAPSELAGTLGTWAPSNPALREPAEKEKGARDDKKKLATRAPS